MTDSRAAIADGIISLEEFERVVEIVSPSSRAAEIREKVLEYLAAGSRLVWVVDPATRSVATYRSREDIRLLTEGDVLEGGHVVPGFRLSLLELFAAPRSPGS